MLFRSRTPKWEDLKEKLLHLYDAERDEARYQLGDLDRLVRKYVKKSLHTLSDWKTYVQKFTVIVTLDSGRGKRRLLRLWLARDSSKGHP